jgi:hypothetical protein
MDISCSAYMDLLRARCFNTGEQELVQQHFFVPTSPSSLYRKHMCQSFLSGKLEGACVLANVTELILTDPNIRLRKSTGNPDYYAPLDIKEGSLLNAIIVSCYKPFRA